MLPLGLIMVGFLLVPSQLSKVTFASCSAHVHHSSHVRVFCVSNTSSAAASSSEAAGTASRCPKMEHLMFLSAFVPYV